MMIPWVIALFLVFFLPNPVHAAVQWSLAVVEGVYYPNLEALNRSLTRSTVALGPRKTDARPTAYLVLYQGESPVMREMAPKAPKFGLQLQADLNPRFAVILGGSVGTLESSIRDTRKFFVGFNIDSPRETRFSLTLNQIWLGVRRYIDLGEKKVKGPKGAEKSDGPSGTPPKPRFYGEVGLLGVTRASLNTDVWLHVYDPEEGFDFYKVVSTASQGSGYATYLGGGGEYYLRKQLSLGIDAQYLFGGIKEMRYNNFFTVDPLEAGLIRVGDVVTVTDLQRGSKEPLFLKLDGWDLKATLRFYF